MIHELKTWPEFFAAVHDGSKTFEIRKDDRGYRQGDVLVLREWTPGECGNPNCVREHWHWRGYTGRELRRQVGFVFKAGFGVDLGEYVVLSLLPEEPADLTALLADLERHQLADHEGGEGFYGCCRACDFEWPCDAARARAELERVTSELDEERTEAARLFDVAATALNQRSNAEAERDVLAEALEQFATRGISADLTPTLLNGQADTGWWYRYLADADAIVRDHARGVLDRLEQNVLAALAPATPQPEPTACAAEHS